VVGEDGRPVKTGEWGEVIARSPGVMKGYWNMPDKTAEAIREGWLWTGDIGYLDDEGYLYIVDRSKDMIISGGENIYPREIEEVLFGHEAVADAAVIGVPNDKGWGEEVKACVVRKPGADLDEAALIAHCRERLAGYKCPKTVDFIEEIPRNLSGKVLKKDLRAPYWEGHDRSVN
jgi:acyl-CoA synthetase (AMP-forming)/AMP-acid ligase II